MKKTFLLFLTALLFSIATAFAQGGTTGPLTWNISGDTLTISGNGAMPDYNMVAGILPPWAESGLGFHIVLIESGVLNIGNEAFVWSQLASVTIPNTVTIIGRVAFKECGLASLTIPNSVTTIESGAFQGCTGLTSSITIPNSVTTIKDRAFQYCTGLISITILGSITTIETMTFADCENLSSITIPSSVKTIGNFAFSDCTSLTSITIPSSVTMIGEYGVFGNCTSLTSITIPNSVTTIGKTAFIGCTSLTSIDVENENSNYASENGVLFNKNKTTLICCPEGKTGVYIIPNGVTTIENLSSCTSLTSITIPSSVTTIGSGAFMRCTGLTSITNLNLVPIEIDNWTFYEVNQSECTLTVPTSAVSAYENAEVWKEFNIVGGGILVNPVSSNSEYGYTTGNGLFEGGGKSTATVTAVAYEGYKFVNWTKNGLEISTENPYSFTVTEDVELVANFTNNVGIVGALCATPLRVYPNPTTGELTIETSDMRYEISDMRYEIFDIYGKKLSSHHLIPSSSNHHINISHLPAGIYFLKMNNETVKVVKQ